MTHIARSAVLATLLLCLAEVGWAQDGRSCSSASLAGAWGYIETGTVVTPAGPVPGAAVGRYDFDAAGGFSGTQYSSVGGNLAQDTKLGAYTVNPDCTGTLTLSVYDPTGRLLRSSVWAFVLTDKAMQLRGTMTSLMLPNGMRLAPIMSMTAARMFPGQGGQTCSNVPGTWGYSWTATFILPTGPAPATAVGRMSVDAAGELTGTQSVSVGGQIGEDTFVGTANVNPDCTGTMTVRAYDQAGALRRTVEWAMVYVDGATEGRAMFKSLTLPDGTAIPLVGTAIARSIFPGRSDGQDQ